MTPKPTIPSTAGTHHDRKNKNIAINIAILEDIFFILVEILTLILTITPLELSKIFICF